MEYTITAINKRTVLDPGGTFKTIYEVFFVTTSGVRDSLEIAEKDYTPDRVKDDLTARAAIHEQIMSVNEG